MPLLLLRSADECRSERIAQARAAKVLLAPLAASVLLAATGEGPVGPSLACARSHEVSTLFPGRSSCCEVDYLRSVRAPAHLVPGAAAYKLARIPCEIRAVEATAIHAIEATANKK